MGNKAGVRHYFAEGLTSRGYISLLPIMMPNWKRTYVLLGGPGTGKSTLIKVIGLELLDRGYGIDFLRSARNPDSMVGFVLPEVGLTMLDALETSPLRWRAPQVIEKFINLGTFCDENKLEKQRLKILETEKKLSDLQLVIEEELVEALEAQLKRKKNKTREPRDIHLGGLLNQLNLDKNPSGPWPSVQRALQKIQQSVITPCFLHGLTAEGWLNLAPHFLADFDQIRLEGDETLDALNWVLGEVQKLGQVVEIVLHPLNPDEMIGIVFPERNLAIWQGNPEEINDQGLDQPFGDKLKEALLAWQAQKSLLKSIYTETVNYNKIDELRETLLNSILKDLDMLSQK